MERKPYADKARPRSSGSAARRSDFVRPSFAPGNPNSGARVAHRSAEAAPDRIGAQYGAAYRRDKDARRNPHSAYRRGEEPRRDPHSAYRHGENIRRDAERDDARNIAPIRPKKRRYLLPLITIGMFALLILVYLGSAWIVVERNKDTFCDNITINGIALSGYTREGGIQAVQDQITQRLDTPCTLTYGADKWTFTARDFGAGIDVGDIVERAWNIGHYGSLFSRKNDIENLEKAPIDWNAEMTYDQSKVDAFVNQIADAVYVPPVDAEVTITTERPYLTTESQTGFKLDTERTREMIINLVETGTGDTALPVIIAEPAISSSDASGSLQVIVEFKTDVTFRDWASRQNVRMALSCFDGLCVWPGETISFNDVVGPRTEARGYKLATEFAGNSTKKGYGGGVCQASTTMYNAVLQAGMTVIERWPHSMTVTYVEPSLDAAVTDNDKNMIFKNETDSAIYIYTSVDKEFATVTIWGNRPKYRNELISIVTRKDRESKYVDYINDTDAIYVYSVTGEPVLYKKGKPELDSEGWLISYDWDTDEEVKRYQLSFDSYSSGTTYYWRGVHDPVTGEAVDPDIYMATHGQ